MSNLPRNGMAMAIALGTIFIGASLSPIDAQALVFRNGVKITPLYVRGCGNEGLILSIRIENKSTEGCNAVGSAVATGGFANVPPGGGTPPGGGGKKRGNNVSVAFGIGGGFGISVAASTPSGKLSLNRGLTFKKGLRVDLPIRNNLLRHSSSLASATAFGTGSALSSFNASSTGAGYGQGSGNYGSTGGSFGSGSGFGGGTSTAGNDFASDAFSDFGGAIGGGGGIGGGGAIGGTFGD